MINLPCNAASMSQVTPCQNVPVQTSQYNFPTCQQRQTSTQQMQTAACGPCFGTSQGGLPTHVRHPNTYIMTHQCVPGASQPIMNPCHPVFQNLPPTHPGCSQLPSNILDQIRACVTNAAPIFILPGNCQPSPAAQQQQQQPSVPPLAPQIASSPPAAYPPGGLTYPAVCYPPPPPFYPYPIPLPFCPFIRTRDAMPNCGCCWKRDVDSMEIRNVLRDGCRYGPTDLDEHRCTSTADDTVCSKKNCPSSLHLQALASQFLSLQGIVPCAATRLVLRKVSGSNVTTTMEDTMAKAQTAINALTKDQLLSESRNAQQVNTLINLHMTANPPPNIIPILTLVQLKMNLLKAQIEGLVNQKIMEIQGIGVEVETNLIDPMVLALKSDAELRDFLSALRQKECNERVNVNFAPYRSQCAIAETRLSNVQNKIHQVEMEFDRRRCATLPAPTLSSRVVQQFSTACYSARFEDPKRLYSTLPPDTPCSPDPFTYVKLRSPKRLLLTPCTGKKETVVQSVTVPAAGTSSDPPKNSDNGADRAKENVATSDSQRSSTENCDGTTSKESIDEAKKKLRPRIIEIDATTVSNAQGLEHETSSLMKLTSNVCVRIDMEGYGERSETSTEIWNGISYGAKYWTAEAYVNVTGEESVKTLTESENGAVTLSEKIDEEDVCETRDIIEIRSRDQTTDRQEFESSSHLQQFKKQTEDEITISRRDEIIKEHDVEIKSLEDVLPPQTDREKARVTTTAEVADKDCADSISRMQETEQQPLDDIYTASLKSTLNPKKERRQDEQEGKIDEILPSTVNATTERSTSQVPMNKIKKKITLDIVSLMANIVYNKSLGYGKKQKLKKEIATSERETSITTDPDIEKLSNHSSIESLLTSTVAHNITGKDHSENIFPERLNLPKLCFDRQCQTTFKKDKNTTAALLRGNIFSLIKNLHKHVTDNEKNGDDVETYSSPITKAGITTTKRLSRCNVTGSILETSLCENNVPYHGAECEGNLISKLFSVIDNRMTAFVNKIITMNGRLFYVIRSAILRKNLNIDVLRRDVPIDDHPELISNYDSFASASYNSSGLNNKTSKINKYDLYNTNLLSISTKEGYNEIPQVKHSIIESQKSDTRYLLIGTSSRNRDSIPTRDLGRPRKVQKSLLIRIRLKNSLNSQDYPHPFSLLKRTEENVLEFRQARRNENIGMIKENKIPELKSSEKFWALTEIVKINETNAEISKMKKYDNESEEKILNQHSRDIKSNVSTAQDHTVVDKTAVNDELVINVLDYLGLQNEINTSIYMKTV